MKLIKQSFEILEQKDFTLKGIKQFIERCARVSYKSEDRITSTSYEKFVGMLESRDHARPLEFGTVHLRMSDAQFETVQILMEGIYNDSWIKRNTIDTEDEDNCYITTNYRYYLEMCKHVIWLPMHLDESDNPLYPRRYTVHMILDRGVMDEFRTHVGLSHLAESTRYCNYSKDKFDNQVTFIIPSWSQILEGEYPCHIDEANFVPEGWTFEERGISKADKLLIMNYGIVEHDYNVLLKFYNWTPQQARSVLPLGVKSELISCGFEDAWKNFFYRRDAKDAHPMAQEIAKPMHEEFIERGFIYK